MHELGHTARRLDLVDDPVPRTPGPETGARQNREERAAAGIGRLADEGQNEERAHDDWPPFAAVQRRDRYGRRRMWWCVPRHRPTPLPVAKVNVLEQDVPTPAQPNPDDSSSWTEAARDEPRSCGSALGNQRSQPDSSSTSPDRVRAGAIRMTRSRGSDLKHPRDGRPLPYR
jgi:hypothetical protein